MSKSGPGTDISSFVRQTVGVLYALLMLTRLAGPAGPDASSTPWLVKFVTGAMFLSFAAPLLAPRKWMWMAFTLTSLCVAMYALLDGLSLRQHPHPDEGVTVMGLSIVAVIFAICAILGFKQLQRNDQASSAAS